ncbi:substrate-binding domain-containing protein [Aquibacillus koreensis]|uniref:Substrate-binding domain-containing protein n=1 Tax=Aquibacillus koreensis TaxID=279446 RepID=A0A9X3WJS3_9BACI|nr:substrate-binding domain-containing protein [Aquibacillus koreensis]MCT2535193.1 substrate-binding domain-containing protein [Aquibacillus koreensis]MDC3421052.1 substrate-binding domain-containing protein [Aquibacillus koreensis]
MRRFFLRAIVVLLMVLVLQLMTSCEQEKADIKEPLTNDSYTPSEVDAVEDTIKIGFLMGTLLEERWQKDRDFFKKSIENLGAKVEVMSADGDDALQIWQAETLISQGVDLLVIIPQNAESAAAIVEKAHAAGIKVLSYDRLVKNAEVDMYVSYDNEKVGELQAAAVTELVPKGKFAYIGGAEIDNNAHLIKKGVFRVLQPLIDNEDITVVFDQWSKDWLPENARANIELALDANNNQIDAIIAANDATAGAVIEVLEERGLAGEIPVTGQDADLAAARRIVAGEQTMTVYKPIKKLTETAAELAVKLAKGEELEIDLKINNGKVEVPTVLLSPIAVDQTNLNETIIADGFHSKEEVYQLEE